MGPDTPVMSNRSNQLASDAPVPHDRCIGPCSAQATREGASSTGCTGGAKRAVGASTGGVFREPVKVVGKDASAPDTPVPHRSIGRCNVVAVAREKSCTGCTSD